MTNWPRNLLTRVLVPLTWRPFSGRMASRLKYFSVMEADSAWQLLHALEQIDDPPTRALVLQHTLEELHHASEFDRVASQYEASHPPKPLLHRDPILDPLKGEDAAPAFLAHAHVGEKDVFDQFNSYAAGIGDCPARSVFLEAKKDELGHVGLTHKLLLAIVGSPKEADRWIRRARLRRAWESWLRFSRRLGEIPMRVLLTVLYVLGLLGGAWACRQRLDEAPGFVEFESPALP